MPTIPVNRRSPLVFLGSAVLHGAAVILLSWSAATVHTAEAPKRASIILVGPIRPKPPVLRARAAIRALPSPPALPLVASAPPPPIVLPSPIAPSPPSPAPVVLPLPVAAPLPVGAGHARPSPAPPQISAGFDVRSSPAAPSPTRTLQSAGFGDSQFSASTRTAGSVTSGAFGEALAAAPPAARNLPPPPPPLFSPVEILYKPRPAYTSEARRLQIEGEVLLNVLFTASGVVEVVRVLRGIGHGLDESAETAARGIRFRPATRGAQPIDSAGVVHIKFELAY